MTVDKHCLVLLLLSSIAHTRGNLAGRRPRAETHVQSSSAAGTELDCGARELAYQYALRAQPWRGTQPETMAALQLSSLCGKDVPAPKKQQKPASRGIRTLPVGAIIVDVKQGSDTAGNGSLAAPFWSVHRALAHTRAAPASAPKHIALREGIHYIGLNGTISLGPDDTGTTISNYPGETPWLSGGVPLTSLQWSEYKRSDGPSDANIWVASLVGQAGDPNVRALFTAKPHTRVARARVPNYDVERDQWGYSSPGRDKYSLNGNMVLEWGKPNAGTLPTFTDIDLSVLPNPTGYLKNNSQMTGYNAYNDGIGGVCNTVWGTNSYWCGNASAGGWAEVDFQCAKAGKLQIPVSLKLNSSAPVADRFSKWANATGAIVSAWHSQSWAMHMFTVDQHDVEGNVLHFRPGSGSQGGRNWCRCDQCTYAPGIWSNNGNWCGRVNDTVASQDGTESVAPTDTRIIGGSWAVENVFEELDSPNEFFYNSSTQQLYIWVNGTTQGDGPPPASLNLITPVLESILEIKGITASQPVTDVQITGISFRDSVFDYQQQWGTPSGGDWALIRKAAVFLENTERTIINDCTFQRLDGNAVMISAYNRDATVTNSTFAYLGASAIAGWGDTAAWDGRSGQQPRFTTISNCYVHDIGLLQKQSSAWFQAKTAQSQFKNNIVFNIPRAAVNFNDGFGGANEVSDNLLFNTCRESGDHGPINTWDRLPFLTEVAKPGSPSFTPAPNVIKDNYIWANYGGSEGVDNDDGSSLYHIYNNVFYDADGFKMDYGGHQSEFSNNLVITKTFSGACIGVGPFKSGIGDGYYNNTCFVMGTQQGADPEVVGSLAQCGTEYMTLHDNYYASPQGRPALKCGGTAILVQDLVSKTGNGKGSTAHSLPSDADIVALMKIRLDL
eukprot:m.227142 g.227142  ORF g.227142 m.227142 type:complete len:896 (+) comp17319_c0_seq2:89-2776(+)